MQRDILESELEALVKEAYSEKSGYGSMGVDESDVRFLIFMLGRCIEKRDLKGTSVSRTEYEEYLKQKGIPFYSIDFNQTVDKFEDYGHIKFVFPEGGNARRFFLCSYLRRVGEKYLREHR
jgi:hypothetical protein